MNNQEILDNAPTGSLIVDSKFRFFDGRYSELDKSGNWTWKKTMPSFPIRSLADIQSLVDKDERIAELEKLNVGLILSWHKQKERESNLQVHNLEQRAKGVTAWVDSNKTLAKRTKPSTYADGVIDMIHNAISYVENLNNQAKAIKDGEL